VTLSFEQVPDALSELIAGHAVEDVKVVHNTVQLRLKEEETRVLDLIALLARAGRILRVEITGASLEDVFVELTQEAKEAHR
jgi:ABC-type uncharacterized transport system ATPase subunit